MPLVFTNSLKTGEIISGQVRLGLKVGGQDLYILQVS